MKNQKLWIDDLREAPDNSWIEARKVESAIRLISMFDFDVISLDHDIENRPDDETFKPVAYYIAAEASNGDKIPQVIIHSINSVGAQQMAAILRGAGIPVEIVPYRA